MEKTTFTRRYRVLREMLREARLRAGLTQAELGELLDEPQSYVSKVESGERRVDLVQLQQYCQALRIPLARFVAQYVENAP